MSNTKNLGYYAMDKDKNLYQFEWDADDTFYIANPLGTRISSLGQRMMKADPKDFEILEIGHYFEPKGSHVIS